MASSSKPFAGAESGSPGRALEAGKRGSPGRAVQAGIRGKRLTSLLYATVFGISKNSCIIIFRCWVYHLNCFRTQV